MSDKKNLTESELYNIGARYCSTAEHCMSEVRTKLLHGTDDAQMCEDVLMRLVADRYVDEERYARAFVSDKFRFAKWGRRKIQQELRRKGIPDLVSGQVLDEMEDESYRETLKKLLEAKSRTVKGKNEHEIKMKLARFAASRGFESALIFDVLGDCMDVSDC